MRHYLACAAVAALAACASTQERLIEVRDPAVRPDGGAEGRGFVRAVSAPLRAARAAVQGEPQQCYAHVADALSAPVYETVEIDVAGEDAVDYEVSQVNVRMVRQRVLIREASAGADALYGEIEVPAVDAPEIVEVRTPTMRRGAERRLVEPARLEARVNGDGRGAPIEIPCDLSRGEVSAVQTALSRAGYDPGPSDGLIGPRTQRALEAFQRSRGLAVGAITVETIDALGV